MPIPSNASEYLPIKTSHILKGSDITIGALAYGCWRFAGTGVVDAARKIETALACGMNLIDTADIYIADWPNDFGAAEALLGDVIAAHPALRHQMVLASKGGHRAGDALGHHAPLSFLNHPNILLG